MTAPRTVFSLLFLLAAASSMTSCASNEPKRRERVPPPVADSTMPWNRPAKWEGSGKYGSMMQGSR
ncbi:MAG: hypothetical protein V4662_06100 [Verrucomicrobiota bacterium]